MTCNRKPLTIYRIALGNTARRMGRSAALAALVALSAFTLVGGQALSGSLKHGMESLSARLGADILAVPFGYEAGLQGALLRGEPSTFYFDAGFTEKLSGVEGVAAATPQLYVSTLNAACCAYPIQLIGFDEATDFVIRPWLSGVLDRPLADTEIVVGSSINAEPGTRLKFFGSEYAIAARLAKTGMGFDTSIFMNFAAAGKAAAASGRAQAQPAASGSGLISSVAIRIAEGYDGKAVANNILQAYAIEGVDVVVAKSLVSGIAASLRGLSAFVRAVSGAMWALAAGVLYLVFAVALNARRREFGIYRALGAGARKLAGLLLCESALVSLWGAACGTALAALAFFPFSAYIKSRLGLPFMQPPPAELAATIALGFAAAFAIGPIASTLAAARMRGADIYAATRA